MSDLSGCMKRRKKWKINFSLSFMVVKRLSLVINENLIEEKKRPRSNSKSYV
jgi:hypothetical protein